jgi:hypothetical protein
LGRLLLVKRGYIRAMPEFRANESGLGQQLAESIDCQSSLRLGMKGRELISGTCMACLL